MIISLDGCWGLVNRKSNVLATSHDAVFDVVSQFFTSFHVAVEQVVAHVHFLGGFVEGCWQPSGLSRSEVHHCGEFQKLLLTKKHDDSRLRLVCLNHYDQIISDWTGKSRTFFEKV